jgi:hypothetical protein
MHTFVVTYESATYPACVFAGYIYIQKAKLKIKSSKI